MLAVLICDGWSGDVQGSVEGIRIAICVTSVNPTIGHFALRNSKIVLRIDHCRPGLPSVG